MIQNQQPERRISNDRLSPLLAEGTWVHNEGTFLNAGPDGDGPTHRYGLHKPGQWAYGGGGHRWFR